MKKSWILSLDLVMMFQSCHGWKQYFSAISQSIAQMLINSEINHFSTPNMVNFNIEVVGSGKSPNNLLEMNRLVMMIKKGRSNHFGSAHIQL